MSRDDIETPAAVVDVDRLERNLSRWQEHCDSHGLANRPHVKTHRCVEIAQRQLELGAVGITCQKLSEAQVMADAGFNDILVPFNIVGPAKLRRLRALLERAKVTVSADDATPSGRVTVTVGQDGDRHPYERTVKLRHGRADVLVPPLLRSGEYTITARYAGTEDLGASEATADLEVKRR